MARSLSLDLRERVVAAVSGGMSRRQAAERFGVSAASAIRWGAGVCAAVEAAGASLLYLPPYSPDFNPIENAFSKLKALLRKAAERTRDSLWSRIADIIPPFSPAECANLFKAAGYDLE